MMPLILIPGLLCDHRAWQPQVAHFGQSGRTVIVPDLARRGGLADMAAAVLAEAPARFALAGHSMGARVAMEMCRIAPERIDRLALFDTGVHGVQPGEREKRMKLVDLAHTAGMAAMVNLWLPPMVHPDRRNDPAFMAPLMEMAIDQGAERFAQQVEALLGRAALEDLLPALRMPVLVGVGDADAWSPPAQHAAFADLIRDRRFALFPGSGHMAPVEAPLAVIAAIEQWLERDCRTQYI